MQYYRYANQYTDPFATLFLAKALEESSKCYGLSRKYPSHLEDPEDFDFKAHHPTDLKFIVAFVPRVIQRGPKVPEINRQGGIGLCREKAVKDLAAPRTNDHFCNSKDGKTSLLNTSTPSLPFDTFCFILHHQVLTF